MYQQNCT